jgi:ATP-dependent protease ClpP protease subunit
LQIARDFNRNYWFNTQEAKDYGLIDTIVRPARTAVLTGIE